MRNRRAQRPRKVLAVVAGLLLIAATHPAKGRRRAANKSEAHLYNPTDYLQTQARLAGANPVAGLAGSPSIPNGAEPANQVNTQKFGQIPGVTCASDAAAGSNGQPPTGPNAAKYCAPGDAACLIGNKKPANSPDQRSKTSAPSGAELAEQLVGLLRDNCRPAAADSKKGFSPAVDVSVAPPAGNEAAPNKRPQVSASFGISGSF